MSDPDELALVVKAIKSGLGGCVEWNPDVVDRVRRELAPVGLNPESIKEDLINFVQGGGIVRQVKEQRQQWKRERDFYYKVILPTPKLKNGLFVEIVLQNSDADYPEVRLVNAHEQT